MRRTLAALSLLSLAIGCGGMPPVYDGLPRSVRRALREDFAHCSAPRGFMIDPAEGRPRRGDVVRYEVRACGIDAVYACVHGERTCELERVVTSGGEATPPLATPVDRAASARSAREIERLAVEWESETLDEPTALLIVGSVAGGGGLAVAFYDAVLGASFCGSDGCPRTTFPSDITTLAIIISAVGILTAATGAILLGMARSRRADLYRTLRDECRQLTFGAGPTLVGIAASICFP